MKIDFQTQNDIMNLNAEYAKSSNDSIQKNNPNYSLNGIHLDITGTVKDNAAYGNSGKKAQDIMQDAEQQDAALQSRYRTVMSNFMSAKDYAKLQEEGFSPGMIPVDEMITMLDKIKVTLAQAGMNVEGFTDEISKEKLEEITGNIALANQIADKLTAYDLPVNEENIDVVTKTVQLSKQIEQLSEAAQKYMIENELPPTVNNAYKAEYSVGNLGIVQKQGYYSDDATYYAQKSNDYVWEQLNRQISKVIESANLPINENTMESGKWLIEQGIPLTEETITAVEVYREISLPVNENRMVEAAVRALSNGRAAGEALLYNEKNYVEQANSINESVKQITDEMIETVVGQERAVTLQNIINVQNQNENGSQYDTQAVITAKRQLEEIRLMMTAEANLKLLKSGFSIDTAPLSELVERLKAYEEQYRTSLFPQESSAQAALSADLWKETTTYINELPKMPADIIGNAASAEDIITFRKLHEQGSELQHKYEKAEQSYEELMTAPRKDLGDSISKAFQNVDDILMDLNLPVNEANRRAVRILGYNSMEIQEDAIWRVKQADAAVNSLLEKITPAVALQLIREGINPLDTDIWNLTKQIDGLPVTEDASIESYSEFLWKLEKNQSLTEEERSAYIGMHRLFRQIEKSDGSVIGSLQQQNADISMKNLLTAVRTKKHGSMDINIDQDFGELEKLLGDTKSISEQILTVFQNKQSERSKEYYQTLAKDVLHRMDSQNLAGAGLSGNMTLEELAWQLKQQPVDEELSTQYHKEQYQEFKTAAQAEAAVIQMLTGTGQPVTADHIYAMQQILYHKGDMFRQLQNMDSKDDKLRKKMEELTDQFTNQEAAGEAYHSLMETAKSITDSLLDQQEISYIDVKAMQQLHKQISLATSMSKEECYEIPVQSGGRLTAMNVRIIHGSEDSGKAVCTMETEGFGKVFAEFTIQKTGISGYITSETKEGIAYFNHGLEKFKQAIKKQTGMECNISVIQGEKNSNTVKAKVVDERQASPKELYLTAKAFVAMASDTNLNIL